MTIFQRARRWYWRKGCKWYAQRLCKSEFEHQRFVQINERPVEFSYVFRHLCRLHPQSVLDVGTGTTALPRLMRDCGFLVTAVDNVRDYWPSGMFNRHYHVVNDDITNTKLDGHFDLITCISVLEHIERSDEAVTNMMNLLSPGGHFLLTCPYKEDEYVQDAYKLPHAGYGQDNKYICQQYSRQNLNKWLASSNSTIADQEYWRIFKGEYWTYGKRLSPSIKVDKDEQHHLTCVLIQKDGQAN